MAFSDNALKSIQKALFSGFANLFWIVHIKRSLVEGLYNYIHFLYASLCVTVLKFYNLIGGYIVDANYLYNKQFNRFRNVAAV